MEMKGRSSMKKWIMTLFLFFTVGLWSSQSQAVNMNYSVKANIPANQIDKSKSYFDLKMKPNQKQVITLTLVNNSDKAMDITVRPNNAVTNANGIIDYSKTEKEVKRDKSLKLALTDLISGNTDVHLKAKETKTVPFTLKMPSKQFDGIILGGFYVHKIKTEEDKKAEQKLQIKNDYSYVIGIKLSETDANVKAQLKLNRIEPGLENYRTVVKANLQNTSSTIIGNMKVKAKITKAGSKKVLHQTTKENLAMAPHSNFDFPINWDNERLENGKYRLLMEVTSNKGKWKFDQDFEIVKHEAQQYNKKAVEVKKDKPNWFVIGITALIIVLVIVIAVLIYLLTKRKKTDANE